MPAILMRMGNARKFMDMLLQGGIPFELTTSNYSMKIQIPEGKDSWEGRSERKNFPLNKKYIANEQSKRTFACFAKIKKDIKEKEVPKINPDELIYFQHDFKTSMYIDTVMNIDLKSAYATILHNDGFISDGTLKYLAESSKQERLSSVGMLASKKRIFNFEKGEPVGKMIEDISPNAGFFYHAVQRTYDIMSDLKRIVGPQYLYTWVDGIYFLPGTSGALLSCTEYLDLIPFRYSVDRLTEFEVVVKPNKVTVTFKKDGKRKVFNLPSHSTEFKRISLEAILLINKKNKHNEKDSGKNSRC